VKEMKRLVTPLTASVAIDFGDSKQLCRCSRLTRSGDEFAAFGLYNSDDCENGCVGCAGSGNTRHALVSSD
jgi:hypothetical protein